MQGIGQRGRRLIAARPAVLWPVAGALCTAISAAWMWGFTVDDALISVRYAMHVVAGVGWRFNATGASTDGVTPLPWPLLLAPWLFSLHGSVWGGLVRAKVLGYLAGAAVGALAGRAAGTARGVWWGWRAAPLLVLGLSVPVAAHAVSGMETAMATLLATAAAASFARPRRAAVAAGWAASLRPEMAPWAITLALGCAAVRWRESPPPRPLRAWTAQAIRALGPFAACALLRWTIWGRPGPLALLAKPSDPSFGLPYVGAALVVSVVPLLVCAPWSLRRSPAAQVIVAASLAHALALIAVGGDWMPYARLWVPVVPSLAIAAVLAAEHGRPWAMGLRTVLALALGITLIARGGTAGRGVGGDRHRLVELARPYLRSMHRVASLDVGWVGAATTTDAEIVDLAGVTDPEVAALPGGHTSKRVSAIFVLGRDPDGLLLYAPLGLPKGDLDAWQEAIYPRAVEARLAADEVIARHFTPAAWLPLGTAGAGYVLLSREVP